MTLTLKRDEVKQARQNTAMFSPENFEKIHTIMYDHSFSAGSHLFWEGDLADKLYYVKSGSIRLTKMTDEGKNLCLYYFRAGDLFGEFDDSEPKVCTFTAEVLEDAEIGIIQQRDLEMLMWQHGDLAIEFMKWFGFMQRFTQLKIRDLMFHGKNGALASTLIRIANTYGDRRGNTIAFTEKFTNAELASLIGATRETVNRMLNQFKKEKLIDMERGHIVILNLDGLKKICRCEECPLSICRL